MKSHCLGDMTIEDGGITLDFLIINVHTPKWNFLLIIEGSGINKFLSFKMTFRPSKTVFPFENSFGSAFHYDCLGWLWWWFGCENFLHDIVLSAIKVCRQQTLISIKLCIKKRKEENTQIYIITSLLAVESSKLEIAQLSKGVISLASFQPMRPLTGRE